MKHLRCLATILLGLLTASPALADPVRVFPVAATASRSYPGCAPTAAVDSSADTYWNAGAAGTQWIQLDLGRTVALSRIRLLVNQQPAGYTRHEIAVGQSPETLTSVGVLAGKTEDNQWLEMSSYAGKVRYIRITTTQSPSWVSWREIQVFQGVEYFGYFASSFDSGDPRFLGDHTVDSVAAGANLVWILTSPETVVERLQEAQGAGAKAVVLLDSMFVQSPGTRYLRQDWRAVLHDYLDRIRNAGLADVVAAFYPVDEPYRGSESWDTMRSQLRMVAAELRGSEGFSATPIATILASGDLSRGLGSDYVAMFDWVGFDCYRGDWTWCDGRPMKADPNAYNPTPGWIDLLHRITGSRQRLLAVPKAFLLNGTDLSQQVPIVRDLSQWQKEFASDGRWVALVPFLWADYPWNYDQYPSGGLMVGAAKQPWIQEKVRQMAANWLQWASYPVDYSASSSYQEYVPFAATTSAGSRYWNAGGFAPAWVAFDLGGSTRVVSVVLKVNQDVFTRPTTHVLYGCAGGACTELTRFHGYTTNGQLLTWTGQVDVDTIKVETTESPTWVAWQSITISAQSPLSQR